MAPTLTLFAAPRGGCAHPWGGPADGRPTRPFAHICSLPPVGAEAAFGAALQEAC